MVQLEDLREGVRLSGIIPNQTVTLVSVKRRGAEALEIVYQRPDGQTGSQLLFRADEAALEVVRDGRLPAFAGDGALLRLVSEAYRIHLAHLFDPVLAVHTSLIEPLPHQITAVYEEMLTRQPLRFLLADDPGAGKTVMAGLLIKELMIRGDVRRCMICVPGNLTEQWQDELWTKFQLPFEIMTRAMVDASRTGNPFLEHDLLIIRLDMVSRDEALQLRLRQSDWDLIICDEAHKLSASFFGGELKETKRYKLGKLLRDSTRHFLLMTATPHNGKEEDFQLFLALLDADRFEGRFRDGVHQVDTSDLMRRMVKEKLVKFDGRPLFPERRAYTVDYELSEDENALYEAVTEYVRNEFNRAEQLENGGRKGTVGFALTVLQRRLASSPEAIYRSLQRRRKRLEKRLQEMRLHKNRLDQDLPGIDEDDWDDLEDLPSEELEALEAEVIDSATAAQSIAELEAEIDILRRLEAMAAELRRRGTDRKWEELSRLLQSNSEMIGPDRSRHKLVIFTEHRDTLNYLHERISTLFGNDEMLVTIHGGLNRHARREAEDRFKNDPRALILLATDAAGEGINLQRAHLMVNYDLPWNPNRLEQRFGRIHRIGQTEVCHLWNLVAGQTREGHVYRRLLKKLETERHALKGEVFDVLGKLFEDAPLRKLLIEAIRYGDQPEVRARLEKAVDNAVDQERLRELLERRSLTQESLSHSRIQAIREDMERWAARRLQPHFIKSFFLEAFARLNGTVYEREPGRYEITHVPVSIRDQAKAMMPGMPVARRYERICFDKSLIDVRGKPQATFISPGHPLLDAVIDLILQRHSEVLEQGAILVDATDPGKQPRMLYYLEQSIQDAGTRDGNRRIISREMHFIEIDASGVPRNAGSAPYLDYRPASEEELALVRQQLQSMHFDATALEGAVLDYAISELVQRHLERVRVRREALIDKTLAAVQERLTKEIYYWEGRALQLKEREEAGHPNARINSARARARADELIERLERRKTDLAQERKLSATPPVIIGRALVVPVGMLLERVPQDILDTRITEQIAMRAVMDAEIALGNSPKDVSAEKRGYDIESHDPTRGYLRFIEVKGRRAGADTVTLTKNELHVALNEHERFILALVEVENGQPRPPRYVRQPFVEKDPGFMVTSVNYNLAELLALGEEPR